MSEQIIRTFVAVKLPDAVRDYLGAVGHELGRQLPNNSVRWVKPAQMHLTLRFLGDTPLAQVDPLAEVLRNNLAGQGAFSLKLSQLGAFPNRKRPRVIWVSVGGDMAQLRQSQQRVESAAVTLGFAPDRRKFNPHLTLGRVKQFEKVRDKKWGGRVEPLPFGVSAVHLIRSDLTPQGPRYRTLHSFELEGARGLS